MKRGDRVRGDILINHRFACRSLNFVDPISDCKLRASAEVQILILLFHQRASILLAMSHPITKATADRNQRILLDLVQKPGNGKRQTQSRGQYVSSDEL